MKKDTIVIENMLTNEKETVKDIDKYEKDIVLLLLSKRIQKYLDNETPIAIYTYNRY